MEEDIRAAREAGADGVVFGCLTPEGELDLPAMERLMKASEGMAVTCHRAFDYVQNPAQTLEKLIGLGVDRVLTSGQQPSALKGAGLLGGPRVDFRTATVGLERGRFAGRTCAAGCRANCHYAGMWR